MKKVKYVIYDLDEKMFLDVSLETERYWNRSNIEYVVYSFCSSKTALPSLFDTKSTANFYARSLRKNDGLKLKIKKVNVSIREIR